MLRTLTARHGSSGRWPGRRGRGRRAALVLGVLLLGVVAGVPLGRASTDAARAPAAHAAAGGGGPCPAEHSAAGAVRAAVCLDLLLYRLEGREQAAGRTALGDAVANPAAVDRLLRLIVGGAPAGGRAACGVLSTRVDSYREEAAQVFVWVAVARTARPGAGASDPASVTAAAWTTDAVLVSWTGARWALADVDRSVTAPPAGGRNLGPDWAEAPYAAK